MPFVTVLIVIQCDATASESASPLRAIMSVARQALGRIRSIADEAAPVFGKGRLDVGSMAPSAPVLVDQLLQAHPIQVEPGIDAFLHEWEPLSESGSTLE